MSYRSYAADFMLNSRRNTRFSVAFANGSDGIICAIDARDAAKVAADVAKRRKTAVVSINPVTGAK